MATAPTEVFRHRLAMAKEVGFNATHVPSDGFTDEYLEVLGFHTDGRTDATLILEPNAVPRTRIFWTQEQRVRARRAMEADYRETVGEEAYARLQGI